MEKWELTLKYRIAFIMMILTWIGGLSFAIGISLADPPGKDSKGKVIYPKKTELDFEGASIEGEIKNPGEFYFQHRPEEKMDSLVKRRKNFHREMLRDVVLSK